MNNPVSRYRVDTHGLLHEAEKQLAPTLGSSPIKAERELIQIVVQVLVADGSLMSSHQPSFEQGNHTVNARHQLRGSLVLALEKGNLMLELLITHKLRTDHGSQ